MLLNAFFWYLVIALAGWLVFPLASRIFAFLPDRGLALARPFGLLLWGYAYWLLVSLGVLQNNAGGVLVALLLVAGLSAWQLWGRHGADRRQELAAWLRSRRKLVLVTEILFLVMFVFWAVVRAANPDASGTEKPMELAFINAIMRSPAFPPSDPWLAGYAISYYYFGYVMVAMLALFTGTPGSVAFNLALASWFALTGLAAYGLIYNLLAAWSKGRGIRAGEFVQELFAPILAPLFVLILSNLEGFLEILHSRGLFWQMNSVGGTSTFWSWLNIQELVDAPARPFSWVPSRPGGIWWWRASRVLQDFDLNGASREIIDEFPAFSYLLGDLHPHVLSMPFVLMAVGLALNVYLRLREDAAQTIRLEEWVNTPDFWLTALALGGLSFLNTWDFPIYVALFAAAAALAYLARKGWNWDLLSIFFQVALTLGVTGGILYLPFYLGFSSQANGLLPSLVFFTRGIYFWIMFASLLLPILAWLIWLSWKSWQAGHALKLGQGFFAATALIAGLWLLMILLGVRVLSKDTGIAGIWGAATGSPLLLEALLRRLASPGTWLSLLILLALTWGLIYVGRRPVKVEEQPVGEAPTDEAPVDEAPVDEAPMNEVPRPEPEVEPVVDLGPHSPANPANGFVILLILLGAGLVLFPEFFYLRDQFGWRMNTIFKFYFQAWIVWACAAAFTSIVLLREVRKSIQGILIPLVWIVLVVMALVYPVYGIWDRANKFQPTHWTLDGADYMQRYQPEEMAAIHWLQQAPYGTVLEAADPGASYTGYARVSTLSGLPTVLGWPGHESQWRGGAKEMGSRQTDIDTLYKAKDWSQASAILQKYQVRYVYIGSLERNKYRPNEALFQQNLKSVFHNDQVSIYEFSGYNSALGQVAQP